MAAKQNKASSATSSLGFGCLALFALPFAFAGIFVFGWAMYDLLAWADARQWVATPATLLDAGLVSIPGDEGGNTYRATARYRYSFGGRQYESRRVAVFGGSDNIGSYQQDRGRELKRLLRTGKPVICYVNPDDPAEALLFRDFRPGLVGLKLVAGLLFAGVGVGLLIGAWIGRQKHRRAAALAAAYPKEPWRWRDDWLAGRLRSDTRTKAWITLGVALFWNGISWPAFIGAMLSDDVHWGVMIVVLLFPLIGLALAVGAIHAWMQWLRWGVSEFEMASVPGVLGGPLAGVIYAPGGIEPQDGFTVSLACIRRVSDGDSSREVTVWQREEKITRDLSSGDGRTLIPVQFMIPYDQPPSEDPVQWKLTVSASVRGADYEAEFKPPVFRTAASSRQPMPAARPTSALYAPAADFPAFVAALGGHVEEDSHDRRVIYFPPFRNLSLVATVFTITAVVSAICVGLYFADIPRLFVWSSGGFAVLMAFVTVNTALSRTRLAFGKRGVSVETSVLRTTRRELPAEHVISVEVEPSGTSVGSRAYQRVVARELGKHDGSSILLANEIARPQDAQRLAEEIRQAIGLADPPPAAPLEGELPEDLR